MTAFQSWSGASGASSSLRVSLKSSSRSSSAASPERGTPARVASASRYPTPVSVRISSRVSAIGAKAVNAGGKNRSISRGSPPRTSPDCGQAAEFHSRRSCFDQDQDVERSSRIYRLVLGSNSRCTRQFGDLIYREVARLMSRAGSRLVEACDSVLSSSRRTTDIAASISSGTGC